MLVWVKARISIAWEALKTTRAATFDRQIRAAVGSRDACPKGIGSVRSGGILIRFASNLLTHSLRTISNIFQEYSLVGYAEG